MSTDDNQSLGDGATFAGQAKRRPAGEVSLGDERTLGGGGDAAGFDTVIDDIEVVDLEARYKVEGTLGQGGMGAVLLATDTRLDRKVAIKRILGEAAGNRMAVQRFLTEAKSIAALNHPNIVQIYDYGRAKDGPFLIMEYVDGGSLLDRCRGEAIPLEEAIDLASALCDGLAKAHDLGIVHRDIKPANVLLTKDGIPKLTDFGLAKAEAGDHGQTMTGAVLGTPDFMPPEQRRDASLVDARSDLWSLAATVYQMVTGKSPKIIRFKDVPEAIQDVLGKALEDEKAARYQTVREFRDALKTSLRAAAPALVSLGEGLCPSCGTKNDSSRRFCRSCSGSLEAPCLSCDKGMPYWEEICGQCGAKQEPLVAERTAAMVAKQADAESRLKDFAFNAAESLARAMQGEKDPRFNQFAKWSEQFLSRIRDSREQQRVRAAGLLREAIRHEQAHDYLSAIHTLEQVPNALHSEALPELDSSVESALARVRGKQTDCERLESRIKAAIASRELGSLMPDVESMLTLKPDRKDVQRIQAQLLERQAKLAGQRDDAVARAAGLIAEHNYPAALAALTAIDRSVETSESTQLRERAEGLVRTVQELRSRIKQAVADKRLDGLLGDVDALLQLVPENAEALKLRDSLLARESKRESDLATLRKEIDASWQACRFEDVAKAVERIPKARLTASDAERSATAFDLKMQQQIFRCKASTAADLEELSAAIHYGRQYLVMLGEQSLEDSAAREELLRCERKHATCQEEREQSARRQWRLRIAIGSGVVAVLTIGLVASAVLVRSAVRQRAARTAIAEGRWEDALAMDPHNSAALVGRARQRLEASPADIEGTFADLDQALRQLEAGGNVQKARSEAYAVRAAAEAKAGRLDRANEDLQAAARTAANEVILGPARAAIAEAWLVRAQQAVANGDGAGTKTAADKAAAAGASAASVATLRANGHMLAAVAALKNGDKKIAVSELEQAVSVDPGLVQTMLKSTAHATLRAAVVADYRDRFDKGLAANDWDRVVRIAAATRVLGEAESRWVGEAIAKHPGGLAAVPPDALGLLPPASISALPPLVNSVGIKLKLIPPGRFSMGEAGSDSDETPHDVTLTKPFYMGVCEVTNAQWRRVMQDSPSHWKDDDRPVDNVSWDEAAEFCKRLSALPDEVKAGRVYRLPTEAEWEYACRAGTTTTYSWGDDDGRIDEYAWFDGNSGSQTHTVGTTKPNAWGLFDMHGNVWEWCADWYDIYPAGPVSDPQGPPSGSGRVYRGGSWYRSAEYCRSANRIWFDPADHNFTLGLRIALSMPH